MGKVTELKWRRWNTQGMEDQDLEIELKAISADAAEIEDRFYKELEFGTGGMRGKIGVGTNRMNIYTVARVTQGYANYLNNNFNSPSAAIAYDSRINSEKFARTAAEVLAENGVRVYIYPELMPTPALSFAVRKLRCSGGIVITASHNPAIYNGYKVYGSDGGQITPQPAAEIMSETETIDIFDGVRRLSFEAGLQRGMITYIGEDMVTAFIKAASSLSLGGDEAINKDVSIVYTPLHGTGLKCVTRCLTDNGFTNISIVKEQAQPDGNFPTCPYPNPEIREAMTLGMTEAKRLGSELLLATDPDCDRVGIAVRLEGDYVLLSGNEVGLLMFDYICRQRLAFHKMPERPILVKTIVTADMAMQIAAEYGVEIIDVLTGFKYIAEQINLLEKKGEMERYIFGFEESCGYLAGGYVRDKDAVSASLIICEMCAYYKMQGKSLLDVLEGLYSRHGYCLNIPHSYELDGVEGERKMQDIMTAFRDQYPGKWAGRNILTVSDYGKSIIHYADGREEKIAMPVSNVLKYTLEGNLSVVIRPSGTEPKLKMYISVSADSRDEALSLEKRLAAEIEEMFHLSILR